MALSPGLAAQRSLALWERAPAEGCGLAFEPQLRRCQLDYSPGSLARLDHFMDALRTARQPQEAGFITVAAQWHLLGFLCFYSGEVLGRALNQAPLWLRDDQAAALAPHALAHLPPLHRAFCARFGSTRGRDGAPLFVPMAAVCGRLFAPAGTPPPPGLAEAAAAWWPEALRKAAAHNLPLPPRPGQTWPPALPPTPPDPAFAPTPAPGRPSAPAASAMAEDDPEALYQQALRHLRGEGVPKDVARARALLGSAAAAGHARSQHSLGLALVRGLGGPVDLEAALDLFSRAGEQGLLDAQLQAAQMHLQHDGVAPDLPQAEHWLRRAAAQGSEKARELIIALEFDRPAPPTLRERLDEWLGRLIDRVVNGIADARAAHRAARGKD